MTRVELGTVYKLRDAASRGVMLLFLAVICIRDGHGWWQWPLAVAYLALAALEWWKTARLTGRLQKAVDEAEAERGASR